MLQLVENLTYNIKFEHCARTGDAITCYYIVYSKNNSIFTSSRYLASRTEEVSLLLVESTTSLCVVEAFRHTGKE